MATGASARDNNDQGAPLPFPVAGILPKEETGSAAFLAKHKKYDGTRVRVAIFDTGVDPGADGLIQLPGGGVKVVDLVDTTGSGDVDTSKVVEANADGTVTGLTGRRLQLAKDWKNPQGKWRVGVKHAYTDLFPRGLVSRLKRERRRKWDAKQREAVTAARAAVAEFRRKHSSPSDDEKRQLADLEARVEALKELEKNYSDLGPVYDVLVWHDGSVWRAVVDTSEVGAIADLPAMTDYRREHQYRSFSEESMLNFSVNIYDDGNVCSIVCNAGAHGTHVAGIVAAYYPDSPELNGVAPGAEIVGVKIGDTRLGSMETGTGLVRGLIHAVASGCDLINLSYGEPSSQPDAGRFAQLASEVVNKHGIIFVASAGNAGPALSTVGSPGGTTPAIISVGAYVSPAMMKAEYSLREKLSETQYTWSSRGPAADGHLGVTISAPGGAIAPVPEWTLRANQLMNGTSMSSPNCTGCIALLLSAAKANKIPVTPHRMRMALVNTARGIPGVETFAQGAGLVQVPAAWAHLKAHAKHAALDVRYVASVPSRGGGQGLYLREAHESERPYTCKVSIDPVFHEDTKNKVKVKFQTKVALRATVPWLQIPESVVLMHGGRDFGIKVDATTTGPGVHLGFIEGLDATRPKQGPLFRLPVTVVRPERLPADQYALSLGSSDFAPGKIVRRFLVVPDGATWADVVLTRRQDGSTGDRLFYIHCMVREPLRSHRTTEHKIASFISPGDDRATSFPVPGGATLEVCVAQFWNSLGPCSVAVDVEFGGLVPSSAVITLTSAEAVTRVDLRTPLRTHALAPSATLRTWTTQLRPQSSTLAPMPGARDALADGRQIHALELRYGYDADEATEITVRLPVFSDLLYESPYEAQMVMIHDANNQVLGVQDAWPTGVKVPKGKLTIRLLLRHDRPDLLDKLKTTSVLVERSIGKKSCNIYYNLQHALTDGSKAGNAKAHRGMMRPIFIAPPPPSALPKGIKPGDVLRGSVTFGSGGSKHKGSGKHPDGFKLLYVSGPAPSASDSSAGGSGSGNSGSSGRHKSSRDKSKRSRSSRLADAVRDVKIEHLKAMRSEPDDRAKLTAELIAQFPDHLPLLAELLHGADEASDRANNLDAVIDAADKIIAVIDAKELAAHFGVKLDPDDSVKASERKEFDKKKSALVDALFRRANAVADKADTGAASVADVDGAVAALAQWVDMTANQYYLLSVRRHTFHARFGTALRLLEKHLSTVSSADRKKLYAQRIQVYDKLGWQHAKMMEENAMLVRYPAAFALF